MEIVSDGSSELLLDDENEMSVLAVGDDEEGWIEGGARGKASGFCFLRSHLRRDGSYYRRLDPDVCHRPAKRWRFFGIPVVRILRRTECGSVAPTLVQQTGK